MNRKLTLIVAAVPFVAICFTVPLWDRVYPLVFGLPFNIFWLIACIPLTTLCLLCAYRLHARDLPAKTKPVIPE
jgi:hypothetical protein